VADTYTLEGDAEDVTKSVVYVTAPSGRVTEAWEVTTTGGGVTTVRMEDTVVLGMGAAVAVDVGNEFRVVCVVCPPSQEPKSVWVGKLWTIGNVATTGT
jgi:hypothetical protein